MGRELAVFPIPSPEAEQRDQLAQEVRLLREEVDNLQKALEHSRDIGVAMGILMATDKVTRECAFQMLRMVSQHQNRKVHVVAVDVLETGTLPIDPRPDCESR